MMGFVTGQVLPGVAERTEDESSAARDGASMTEGLVNITDMFVQLLQLGGRSAALPTSSHPGVKGKKVTTLKLRHDKHAGHSHCMKGLNYKFTLKQNTVNK